jgi:hypothetical protein
MTSLSPLALQIPWRQSCKIVAGSASNLVTAAVAKLTDPNSVASKVFNLQAVSNDTIAHDIQVGVTDSTQSFFVLGTVTVPINAGAIGTVPSLNLLVSIPGLPLDETGQPYLILNSTDSLQVRSLTSVSTGKEIDIVCFGGDF